MKLIARLLVALALVGALAIPALTVSAVVPPPPRYEVYQANSAGTAYVKVDATDDRAAAIAEAQSRTVACGCGTFVSDTLTGTVIYRSAHTHWTITNQYGAIYAQGDSAGQLTAMNDSFFAYFSCNLYQRCTETFVTYP